MESLIEQNRRESESTSGVNKIKKKIIQQTGISESKTDLVVLMMISNNAM